MIRPALPADLPLLGGIEASAATLFLGTPMAFVIDHPLTPMAALTAACARGTLLVAVGADDTPQGFLLADVEDGWFHILEISVHADAQRRGHGRDLVAQAATVARRLDCRRLSLTTDRDIAWNGPWYRALGFAELAPDAAPDWLAGILRREAAHGLDPARRCIMVKPL